MADTEPSRNVHPLQIFKVVIMALNLLLGIAGIFFFSWLLNLRAAWKSFTLMLACTLLLILNYNVMRGKLLEKYTLQRMTKLRRVGIVLTITSCVIFLTSLAQGYMHNQDFRLDGYYAAAIPSVLSMFWFAVLGFEANSHLKEIPVVEDYAKLAEEGNMVV